MKSRKILFVSSVALAMCLTSCVPATQGDVLTIDQGPVLELEVGEQSLLSATLDLPFANPNVTFTWISNDPSVASVIDSGLVTGEGNGNAIITVSFGTYSDSIQVIVGDLTGSVPAQSLFVYDGNKVVTGLEVPLNGEKTITAQFFPSNAIIEELTWESQNESVATIINSQDNLIAVVRGVTIGETSIKVVSENNLRFNFTVEVVDDGVDRTGPINTDADGNYLFDIYAINDFHGATEYAPDLSEPGINRLAHLIREKKADNAGGSYVISSGDMWQGSADSNITKGSLVTEIMNELDFASMTIGNHEFDWGIPQIEANIDLQEYPMLACNIKDKSESSRLGQTIYSDLTDPYTIIDNEASGKRIGIIGAIGTGLTNSILASMVKNFEFVNPNELVKAYAEELRQEEDCDIVLYSLHDDDSGLDPALADSVDAVFTAHSHRYYNKDLVSTSTSRAIPVIQSSSNGKNLGHIQLEVNLDTNTVTHNKNENFIVFNESTTEDPAVKEIYEEIYESEIKPIKEEVVGETSRELSREEILDFSLAATLKKYHALDEKVIVSAANSASGGVRSTIPAGEITYGDIYKSLPFDNALYVADLKDNEAAYNIICGGYNVRHILEGHVDADAYSNQGYKIAAISYIFEKYNNYQALDYELFPDYPRDLVVWGLKNGMLFN